MEGSSEAAVTLRSLRRLIMPSPHLLLDLMSLLLRGGAAVSAGGLGIYLTRAEIRVGGGQLFLEVLTGLKCVIGRIHTEQGLDLCLLVSLLGPYPMQEWSYSTL